MIERKWHDCYVKKWTAYGLPDEAIAHPAKMAPKLTERIIQHGIEQGWWSPRGDWHNGDLIGDPFGGIGTTGLVASWFGLRAFLMELETRFVRCALGHDCPGLTPDEWEKYKGRWHKHPDLCPRCGRKDAFEWRRNPPLFGDGDGHDYRPYRDSRPWKDPHRYEGVFERLLMPPTGPIPVMVQGDSRFEFAKAAGQLAGVVCSPPWEMVNATSRVIGCNTQVVSKSYEARKKGEEPHTIGYGHSPGQIGAMKPGKLEAVVTSPPYADSVKGAHEQKETAKHSRDKRETEGGSLGQSLRSGGYGTTEGNIGAMKAGPLDAVVTSPPWENQEPSHAQADTPSKRRLAKGANPGRVLDATYGQSDGQLGNTKGETYWEAVKLVYQQCHQAIKPGGYIVVVVKAYVKNGAIVPLPEQTFELLKAVGFAPVEWIRAWQVSETKSESLWGETLKKTTKTKGFFRQLAEAKGSPRIDYEVVIVMRRD